MNTLSIIFIALTLIVLVEPRILGLLSVAILFLLICILHSAYTLWIKAFKKEYDDYSFIVRACKYLGGKLDFIREKLQE